MDQGGGAMNWSNLKKNNCPKCSKMLTNFTKEFISCKCGFTISVFKFNKIIHDQNNKVSRFQQEASNQDALNNF